MDECKVCGRKNPIEGANFCFYCGASLRDTGDDGNALASSGLNRDAYGTDDRNADPEDRRRIIYGDRSPYGTGRASLYGDGTDEMKRTAQGSAPAISRWKILGLMMLLLLPVYGWLFLLGWAIVNVVSSRAPEPQKELAHGMLMFFATAIVLLVLVSAYLNAHPEIMEEYNRMYQQMMGSGGV